jgi:hypothetical protein
MELCLSDRMTGILVVTNIYIDLQIEVLIGRMPVALKAQ